MHKTYSGYVTDGEITKTLEYLRNIIGNWYLLVNIFDSTPDYDSAFEINRLTEPDKAKVFVLNGKLVTTVTDSLELSKKYSWFNWFDQVYIFEHRADINSPTMHITTETPLTEQSPQIASLADILISCNITLALGDGCGLNYITTNKTLAEKIEKNWQTND